MRLIIAEKPSMGRTIACAVGADCRNEGYMEGNGYIVSWCFGHLYEMADLEKYWDPDYRKGTRVSWEDSMSHLPFFPDNWKFRYEPKQDCRDQIRVLRGLINRPDIDLIYAAGDADREGEVIVRFVLDANLKKRKRVVRLWLPSLTDEVIHKAVINAKPIEEYDNLYKAGRTRAAVDWMIGIELTRFCSVKAKRFIRIGRCICPIVARIVEREKEIRDFIPEKYYAVAGEVEKDGRKLTLSSDKRFSLDEKKAAEEYARKLNGQQTVVSDVDRKKIELSPGRLFSLSLLQSFVCKKEKRLKPSDVLEGAQSLYEKGYITYPRTNSCCLCRDESGRVDGIIIAFQRAGYPDVMNKPSNKKIYDDSKVESHSAITPTERIPRGLSATENIVYECVKNRFLAVFSSVPCIVERTQLTITCGDETFHLRGDVMVQEGWQRFEKVQKTDQNIPGFQKGEALFPAYAPVGKQTSPSRRYTVESLNNWMLSPLKNRRNDTGHMEYTDEEWKDILSEATICTEATRADTIDRCLQSKYMVLHKGEYEATEDGFYLVRVMEELGIDLSVGRTVRLSKDLHDISVGKKSEREVLEEMRGMLTGIIKQDARMTASSPARDTRAAIGKCPVCGSLVHETQKAFSCSGSECRFRLWKDSRYFRSVGIRMTKARAKALLKDGKFFAKGLKSGKSGRTYDAYICIDGFDEDGRIRWKMEFKKQRTG